MALDHDTMMKPPIEQLLEQVDESKFALVTLAARRARHINSYFNQLGEGLGHMIPPQVSSTARKPLSIAFEEIAEEKIVRTDAPVEDELEFDPEAEAQAMADAAEAEQAETAED
jgi:DNA-directed RNA polymerase subunit omega